MQWILCMFFCPFFFAANVLCAVYLFTSPFFFSSFCFFFYSLFWRNYKSSLFLLHEWMEQHRLMFIFCIATKQKTKLSTVWQIVCCLNCVSVRVCFGVFSIVCSSFCFGSVHVIRNELNNKIACLLLSLFSALCVMYDIASPFFCADFFSSCCFFCVFLINNPLVFVFNVFRFLVFFLGVSTTWYLIPLLFV